MLYVIILRNEIINTYLKCKSIFVGENKIIFSMQISKYSFKFRVVVFKYKQVVTFHFTRDISRFK